MTLRVTAFFVIAAATIAASPPPVTERDRVAMVRELDQLCSWTGLRRLTDLRDLQPWKRPRDSGCSAKVDLALDGKRRHYKLNFAQYHGSLKICNFIPDDYEWYGVGIGFDTLKDPAARAFALAAVKKLNEHLHWKWKFGPEIQRAGGDILVSYETVSPKDPNYALYIDPYVSFLVSPKGTVFAGFFGA